MSMSTHIHAFRDMDGEFKRMMDAKVYCDAHSLSYPREVDTYFRGSAEESEQYLRDEMLEIDIRDALTDYSDHSSQGYEVDVSKLPKEVKTIRFVNSW